MRLTSFAAVMMCFSSSLCLAQLKPCPPSTTRVDGGTTANTACVSSAGLLAERYPGDVGIANDPDVIWYENFEAASISAITSRYNTASNPAGLTFDSSVPANSRGAKSLRFHSVSGGASNDQTTDLFKNFGAGYDEMFVRYYVRYQPNVQWHHSGMWIGGYNPATNWPNPRAGTRPNGDERFSIGFEPKYGPSANVQLEFYNYWMNMRSWQLPPPTGNSGFFGNHVLHDTRAMAPGNAWVCVELHVKMNEPASTAGGELGAWINDTSMKQFTSQSPLGYWVRDKFCPNDTTDAACTDFRPANPTLVPLDLRWRSTSALKVNHIWMNNYLSGGPAGSMWMDDVVVAKKRIGCLR